MDIIEKLGITPGPLWLDSNNEILQGPMGIVKTGKVYYTALGKKDQSKANGRLYSMSPEMLEALIMSTIKLEYELEAIGGCDHSVGICCCDLIHQIEKNISIIQKAAKRPWKEIQELLK